jgi:hypothetical protein
MFETKLAEDIRAHILCSIMFFRKSCRLWDNVKKYGTAIEATDDNTRRRMRVACWTAKVTNTHPEYLLFFDNSGYATAPRTLPVLLLRTERPQIAVITTATAEKFLQREAGNPKFCETFVPVYQIARRRISRVRSSSVRYLPMLDWEGGRRDGRRRHVSGIHWILFWPRLVQEAVSDYMLLIAGWWVKGEVKGFGRKRCLPSRRNILQFNNNLYLPSKETVLYSSAQHCYMFQSVRSSLDINVRVWRWLYRPEHVALLRIVV